MIWTGVKIPSIYTKSIYISQGLLNNFHCHYTLILQYNNKGSHEVLKFNRLCLTEMALDQWIMRLMSSNVDGLVAKKICYKMVPNMWGVSNHRQHNKGQELLSSSEMIWTCSCATFWIGDKSWKIWCILASCWTSTASPFQLNTQYKINKYFLPAWGIFLDVRLQIKIIFNNYFFTGHFARNLVF